MSNHLQKILIYPLQTDASKLTPLSPFLTKHGESLTFKFLKRVGTCVIRIASTETKPFVQATRSLKRLNDRRWRKTGLVVGERIGEVWLGSALACFSLRLELTA